ncbi:MAG TPA: helix-turn-helix transcriptional regulator [Candidatus Saccharimonadales bacterium]
MTSETRSGIPPEHDHEEPESPKVSFGEFLKARRAALDKSQRQMGLKSGHLSQIESGAIPKVSPFTLLELAEVYEFSLSELVNSATIDEELVTSARAILIGEAVMGLSESDRQAIVEPLHIEGVF